MRSLRNVLVLVLLGAVSTAGAEPQDPIAWLEQMTRSARALDYEGTFVYRYNGDLQSLRIVHSAGEGKERERLSTLSGPPREVIRDGERVACIRPDNEVVWINRAARTGTLPLSVPERLSSLEPHYRIVFAGRDRVAERDVRKVSIEPRDRFRYGYRYWIADDSGLLLRAELVDGAGVPIEQLVFTSLQIHDAIPERLLEPAHGNGEIAWRTLGGGARNGGGENVDSSLWQIGDLPEGFEKVIHRKAPLRDGAPVAEHMVFSDGLASVSVFVEAARDGEGERASSSRGALNAHARTIAGYRLMVLGEVPPETVKRIAEAITPLDEAGGS